MERVLEQGGSVLVLQRTGRVLEERSACIWMDLMVLLSVLCIQYELAALILHIWIQIRGSLILTSSFLVLHVSVMVLMLRDSPAAIRTEPRWIKRVGGL